MTAKERSCWSQTVSLKLQSQLQLQVQSQSHKSQTQTQTQTHTQTRSHTHARTYASTHARPIQCNSNDSTAPHRTAPHRAAPRTHTTSATFCTLPLPPSKWARVTDDRAYARACVRAAAVAASVPDLFKHKSLLLGASPAQPPQPARSSQPWRVQIKLG